MKPNVLPTTVMIPAWGKVTFPVITTLPQPGELAVVAVVTGTETKIEFWIDVVHALKVTPFDLLLSDRWIEDFAKGSEEQRGEDVRGQTKGWTRAILTVAIDLYEQRFGRPPQCMVGVFGQINKDRFWQRFSELYPGQQMAHFDLEKRAEAASRCIQATPFWQTRQALGYTQLMFEVQALGEGEVLVRAFRDGLPRREILGVANTQKTHPELAAWNSWLLTSPSQQKEQP